MSELIVDRLAPQSGSKLTLSSSVVQVEADIQTKGNLTTIPVSLVKNKLNIPVLVLNDTSTYGFSYITDERQYNNDPLNPKVGIKFQTNPNIGIGGKVIIGEIDGAIPSVQISSGSTRNIQAFADRYSFTAYPGDLSNATAVLKIQDEKMFISSKHGELGSTYVSNHIGSESLIVSGNVKIHGNLLVDTFISGGTSTLQMLMAEGSIQMNPNTGAPYFGNVDHGKLTLAGGETIHDQGQPSIISSGSLTIGIGGTGSIAAPFFSIISGAVGGPDAIMKPNVNSKKLFFIDHLGRITASNSVSASGHLFASTSISENAAFQTVMVDTASGQFYYTGSYGNTETGTPTTTFTSLTDTPGTIPVNQYLISNDSGELTFVSPPPTGDDDWHIMSSPSQLTSSRDIYVSHSITASHNIRVGAGLGEKGAINFGSAGTPYGASGNRIILSNTPDTSAAGMRMTATRYMHFGVSGLYYWSASPSISASGQTTMILNTKGFLGVSQIMDYFGSHHDASENNPIPAALSVIGNISASDGGNTGAGGFLNISASQATTTTNNLVHDPITGRVHYAEAIGTGGDDLDWTIQDIPDVAGSVGAFGIGAPTVFTNNQRAVFVQNNITASNNILAGRHYRIGPPNTLQHTTLAQTSTTFLQIGTNPVSFDQGVVLLCPSSSIFVIGQNAYGNFDDDGLSIFQGTVMSKQYVAQSEFAGEVKAQSFYIYSASKNPGTKQYDLSGNTTHFKVVHAAELNTDAGPQFQNEVHFGNKNLGTVIRAKLFGNPAAQHTNICTSVTMSNFIDYKLSNPSTFEADWPGVSTLDIIKCDLTASGLLFASASDSNGTFNNVVTYDINTGRFYYTGSYGGAGGGSSDSVWTLDGSNAFFTHSVAIGTSSFDNYQGSRLTIRGNKSVATFIGTGSAASITIAHEAAGTVNVTASIALGNSHRLSLGGSNTVSDNNLIIMTTSSNEGVSIPYAKGNVGLGVTTPQQRIQLKGNISSSGNIYLPFNPTAYPGQTNESVGIIYFGKMPGIDNSDVPTFGSTINEREGVAPGIPNSVPHSLVINGSGSLELKAFKKHIDFYTNNSPRMRILSNGTIGMGYGYNDPDSTYKLDINGDTNIAGDLYINDVNLFSDQRLKENIEDLEPQLEIIKKLQPRKYDWKEKDKSDVGFIAQEIKEVIPKLVVEGKDKDKTLSVNYTKMIPLLVKSIQEQQELIEKLSNKVNELEIKLNK